MPESQAGLGSDTPGLAHPARVQRIEIAINSLRMMFPFSIKSILSGDRQLKSSGVAERSVSALAIFFGETFDRGMQKHRYSWFFGPLLVTKFLRILLPIFNECGPIDSLHRRH